MPESAQMFHGTLHHPARFPSISIIAFWILIFAPGLLQAATSPYLFSTPAGSTTGPGAADGTGSDARFAGPSRLASDTLGNLYLADALNHTIRRISPDGVVTTVAGSPGKPGNTSGPAGSARFLNPAAVAVAASGTIYIVDAGNHTIRKLTPGGVVSTIVGLPGVPGNLNGDTNTAQFNNPQGIAADLLENIFVADSSNHLIRKISTNGITTTFAGTAGASGANDGVGTLARFNSPTGLAFDFEGNLLVADTDNSIIRRITPDGTVTTLAGAALQFNSTDGNGSTARFNKPQAITIGSKGVIYVADTLNSTIRALAPDGSVTTFAGTALRIGASDGLGNTAGFFKPQGIAAGPGGTLFVSDTGNHTLRKILPTAVVTTFAGAAVQSGTNDATGSAARFRHPYSVVSDGTNLFVADTDSHTIRKITPSGAVTTFAGSPGLNGTHDGTGTSARFYFQHSMVADNKGNLFVADTENHTIRVITSKGVVTTLAGSAGLTGSVDGLGTGAVFWGPSAIAMDSAGNLFVADTANCTIRKVTQLGAVTTLAGGTGQRGTTDGRAGVARFNEPRGIAVDNSGVIYLADSFNHSIRKLKPDGTVSTFAGIGSQPGAADGTGITARFRNPQGIALDNAGNLFVADSENHAIRRITPAGVVTTVAGTLGLIGNMDGPSLTARFWNPIGVSVDSSGALLVADTFNNAIRVGQPIASAPKLSITRTITGLNLSWDASPTGFLLESSPTVGPGSAWTPVTNNLLRDLPTPFPSTYFRLRQ